MVNARDFIRLVGFYLAEGSKKNGQADIQNTNVELVKLYHNLVGSFVRSEVRVRNIDVSFPRTNKQLLRVGGVCLEAFFVNAIDGVLSFLGENRLVSGEVTQLGLSFLNGDSDGDGSVARAKQKGSNKPRMQLRIAEGERSYALGLLKVVRRIFGVGSIYKPKGRNYYNVVVSLTPQRAALMLISGFFSKHAEMRRRLATKALDSAYISRYLRLYVQFGTSSFCQADLAELVPRIGPDFIGRSVTRSQVMPVGVVRTGVPKEGHWQRSYILSSDTQILARLVLEGLRSGVPSGQTIKLQEFQGTESNNRRM
jgi:hypothetical protein